MNKETPTSPLIITPPAPREITAPLHARRGALEPASSLCLEEKSETVSKAANNKVEGALQTQWVVAVLALDLAAPPSALGVVPISLKRKVHYCLSSEEWIFPSARTVCTTSGRGSDDFKENLTGPVT